MIFTKVRRYNPKFTLFVLEGTQHIERLDDSFGWFYLVNQIFIYGPEKVHRCLLCILYNLLLVN